MKRIHPLCIGVILSVVMWCAAAHGGMVVIVHPDNEIDSLSRSDVVDLYMGRYVAFPNGRPALPLDLPVDSETRAEFYSRMTGKSIAQINAYWARIIFTGRATPPRIVSTVPGLIQAVQENRNAIAYIDSADLTDALKVVFQLE